APPHQAGLVLSPAQEAARPAGTIRCPRCQLARRRSRAYNGALSERLRGDGSLSVLHLRMLVKPADEQLALIRRGVEQIVPEDEMRKKLERSVKTGKPLRVKYGIDPTGIDVHLGHTVPLRKLRLFQELGHQAVLIIGNYTALVGDPSGRDQTRARPTQQQDEANARDYLAQ